MTISEAIEEIRAMQVLDKEQLSRIEDILYYVRQDAYDDGWFNCSQMT